MESPLRLLLDRSLKGTLSEQIHDGIAAAIDAGVLRPGARLPSWLDLASQLGVARGTVKAAYDRLSDEQRIVASRSHGTRVAAHRVTAPSLAEIPGTDAFSVMYRGFASRPAIFQMGIPASEFLPVALLARLRARAAREETVAPAVYPDLRGEPGLRREIAAHLAISRGIKCGPSQVFVTTGFSGALGLITQVVRAEGRTAWVENPGFPPARRALGIAGFRTIPVRVDAGGIDVADGIAQAPDAALALVTPGQQAPLGGTLSLSRRVELIEWAARADAWIVEDDYLGELQLQGHAAPALASLDTVGRVMHVGSFSKTISPKLRLGFVVVPPSMVGAFSEAAICFASAPDPAVQMAISAFLREGHYLRHLRRMKRIYASRSALLHKALVTRGFAAEPTGLAVLLRLDEDTDDVAIAAAAGAEGMNPAVLSEWYERSGERSPGLLLGVATVREEQVEAACDRLAALIGRHVRSAV